jgi:hypothetical protein
LSRFEWSFLGPRESEREKTALYTGRVYTGRRPRRRSGVFKVKSDERDEMEMKDQEAERYL